MHVAELFERQAARTPDATALLCGAERVTYADLDAWADRLTELVADAGARRGACVGVHLERGTVMVASLLAVLKAGAGYVMLDPELPDARLREMVADSAAVGVLTTRDAAARDLGVGVPLVYVDAEPQAARRAHGEPGESGDVACVMFTSGSTGRPKGIVAPHHAIAATVLGQDFAEFGPGSVWLQCSPVSWDAFAMELWGPLLSGGTCVLQQGQRPDPVLVRELTVRHGVTAMYLSGSLFNVVVDEYPDVLDGLRTLVAGGEVLSPAHVARALRRAPELRFYNGYGPVEGMVFLTVHPITPGDAASGSIPIGTPLAGKRVHVLDERLRPVADGEAGELYAAGAGVALGYASQPALTAERFVADPLGGPGERAYRTGDVVRRRADGVLEFVGRLDDQVKVRGYRVEPAEVEAVLAGHGDVDRAAVVAREDERGDGYLVAYAVPSGTGRAASDELRAHVAQRLPDYLVPAQVVWLDAFPVTANGKLDRAALPELARAEPAAPAGEPRTWQECRVAELFADVLGLPAVGAHDSFFDLGGDSLQVTRLLGRLHRSLGADVDVRTFFAAPTVAGVAPHLATEPAPEPVATGVRTGGDAPLSYAQRRLWFLDRVYGGVAYNMPMLVRLRGRVDPAALEAATADVVARHEALRTTYQEVAGEPVKRVVPAGDAVPPFEHLHVTAGELDDRVVDAATRRFDLRTELPFRAVLFSVADDQHALLLLTHHIANDGWSLPPLFRDVSTAYAAHLAGSTTGLPAADVGYADCAERQRRHLGSAEDPGSVASRQLAYWAEALRDAPGAMRLPRRQPQPLVPGPAAATTVRRVEAATHATLVELARRHGATFFMVLHSALAAVLRRAGAGDDVLVGASVSGRGTGTGVDDVVGFFVNLVVLRSDLAGDPAAAELLDRVRDADLAAFAHQDAPFEHVVDRLNPPRSPGRNPFADVVLALQNNARAHLDLPGTESTVEVVRTGEARFELLVDATDEYTSTGAADGVTVTFEYRTDAFDAPVVDWLADALVHVLEVTAKEPDTRLSQLELPAPPEPACAEAVPAAPQAAAADGELADRVAAVWADLLGVPEVDRNADFFESGGNSLRAVRLAARLTTAEGRLVTAAQVFATPTVAGLARALEDTPAEPVTSIPRQPRVRSRVGEA